MHSSPLGRPGTKDTGGMSTYLRELALAMGAQGHRIDLFTRVPCGCRDEKPVPVGQGARLIQIEAGRGRMTKASLYGCIEEFSANLDRFARAQELCYDLIFCHYWLSGCAGRILARRWDIPLLIMFHTLGALKNAAGAGENEPELRLSEEEKLAGESHLVISATDNERAELVSRYGVLPEKIRVIPCGVNSDLFRPLDRGEARARLGLGDGKTILYVGRIEPVKGIDLLVESMAFLPEDVSLMVVGGDERSLPLLERLRGLAGEIGVGERIHFTGSAGQEKLPLYYSAADATVIASHYESFGLVALESLACGTPVISTDVGAARHIIRTGETGYLLERRSPDAMASAIGQCLSVKTLWQPPAIRSTVAGFAWPRIASRVADACRELMAGSPG